MTNLEHTARAKVNESVASIRAILMRLPDFADAEAAAKEVGALVQRATFLGSIIARSEASEARAIAARVGGACDECGNHGSVDDGHGGIRACHRCGRAA